MVGYVDGRRETTSPSNSVTPEMVNAWSETSLPTLLYNYDLKDIYKTDEFGLFYQCVPNKTYSSQKSAQVESRAKFA